MELHCPACKTPLVAHNVDSANVWMCRPCGGLAISVAAVPARISPDTFKPLWLQVARNQGAAGALCPSCDLAMQEVVAEGETGSVLLDVCQRCQMIWFDPAEFSQFSRKRPSPSQSSGLSSEAKRLLASGQVAATQRMKDESDNIKDAATRARAADPHREFRQEDGIFDLIMGLLKL